ncbi:MAG: family 16 glycosylhydrolase [Bacteroidota bacterium]|nr:family 16 glycosylhydrolase [Bacteroidota bacterium]
MHYKCGNYLKVNQLLAGFLTLIICLTSSCKKESGSSAPPDISVNGSLVTIVEDDPSESVSFNVVLSSSCNKTVSIDYRTADSTAAAGKDYVAINSGKLEFKAGETSKQISINIIQNAGQTEDSFFKVVFSNPVNGILKAKGIAVKIENVDYTKLTWSDEFSEGPLNTSTWNYELGANGWGNNELENYTNAIENVHIDSGYLHITALNPSGSSYTSGRITTKGKKEFTHCRVDIRAKMPEGKGIWPALWMLGANFSSVGWPGCGEIDVLELLGDSPSVAHGSIHWYANSHVSRTGEYTMYGGKFSQGFHIFSLVWTPNSLIWLVDNQQFLYFSKSEISGFPLDLPQFFIFNVAVGGNWPGNPDQTTVFPQNMIVDYIRVYQ